MSMTNYVMLKLYHDVLLGHDLLQKYQRMELLFEGDKLTFFICGFATVQ